MASRCLLCISLGKKTEYVFHRHNRTTLRESHVSGVHDSVPWSANVGVICLRNYCFAYSPLLRMPLYTPYFLYWFRKVLSFSLKIIPYLFRSFFYSVLLGSITVMRNLLNLKMHEVFDDWGIQSLNALFLQPFLYLCEIRPDVWACVCIFKQFPEA